MSKKALPRDLVLSQALGEVIKAHMKISQAALATQVGVGTRTMERWLSGERSMLVDSLIAIARALGSSASGLLAEAEERLKGAPDVGTPAVILPPRPFTGEHDSVGEDDLLDAVADGSPDEDALRDERGEW